MNLNKYYAILTDVGLSKLNAAQRTNNKVQLTHMLFGDGNGTPYSPTGHETSLKREVWRTTISEFGDQSANLVSIEAIIPAEVGGWTIREAGVIDSEGDLIAIANYQDTPKPILNSNGTTLDLTIKLLIEVNNSNNVTVTIDPNVANASRKFVEQTIEPITQQLAQIEVRPEQFGAIGNGIADDTTALQDAADFAYENQGFVSLTGIYNFTKLRLETAAVWKAKRRATLKHIGAGIAIDSKTNGNNLNTCFEGINFWANPNTTILFDASGFGLANFNRCNFYAGGSTGTLVKCGRGDSLDKTGYYNNFNGCYFNGEVNSQQGNLTGILLINSANSNRFNYCRFDYIKDCVVGEPNTNNNTFLSCAFENFETAIRTSGRAYSAIGCRFEMDNASSVAMHIVDGGFYNTMFGCHFQGISNTNKFKDESNSNANYYFSDNAAKMPESDFNAANIKNVKTLGLTPQTSYFANGEGTFIYYGNENTTVQKGLYFNDRNTRKKVQTVGTSTNANLSTQVGVQGEFLYNSTLNKPMVNNGTSWIELTKIYKGSGSPEGVQTGVVTDFYHDTTNNKLYYKQSGTGNTGWKEVTLV